MEKNGPDFHTYKTKLKGGKNNYSSEFCDTNVFRKNFIDLCVRRRIQRIRLVSQIVLKMCSGFDDVKDIKENKDVKNDVLIFIDTMNECLIQDVLKSNFNDMMRYSYQRPPEIEDANTAVTMLDTCARRYYNKLLDSSSNHFNLPNSSIHSHYLNKMSCYAIC